MKKRKKTQNKVVRELRARLAEAEELLSAIKSGAVDAFVTEDNQVFTLKGADRAYRVLVETINEGAATLAYGGTIMYCNHHLAKMLGHKSEKIVGRSILDFVTSEQLARLKSLLRQSKDNTMRAEFLFKRSGKTLLPVLVTCNSLELEKKGLCMVITDLSKQKNAESELKKHRDHLEELVKERTDRLRESNKKFRLAFENSEDAIVWADTKTGILIDCNVAAEKLFERPKAEFIGCRQTILHPPKMAGATRQIFKKYVSKRHGSPEVPIITKSGTIRTVLISSSVVTIGDRRIIQGIFRDITERKRLEEELKKHNENLEAIVLKRTAEVAVERERLFNVLETLPALVCLLTPDYHINFANKAFRDKFREGCGRHCYEYCFGKKEPCEFCESFNVLKTGKPHRWECVLTDGSVIVAHDFPFTDVDGSSLILEMDIDITEQRKAQTALLDSKKEIARAKRLSDIGVLAATIAHELRNPLAAIGMAVYNVKRKANSPNLDKHLTMIDKKIAESNQIINNLLFYSRLKPPNFEKVNILDILIEAIEESEDKNRKGVKINKNLDSLQDVSLEVDPNQLREVFNNILNNSYDAVPTSTGEINIVSEINDAHVVLSIEDNGPGIGQDIIDKIFDPFFTTKAKGTGLGLSVCKQIVAMHDGEIDVKRGIAKGTCVFIRLPQKKQAS